jgi:hypothetical protein
MNQPSQQFTNKELSWRHGKQWFDQGVFDFKSLKSYWYFACLVLGLLMMFIGQFTPKLMPFTMIFISPLFTAFMMSLCKSQNAGQAIKVPSVISSIQLKLSDFFILGVISAALGLLAQQIHLQLLHFLGLPVELTEEMVKNMTGKEAFVRSMLNMVTNLPVAMALAFSPALILFNNSKPIKAITNSFLGVIKGWKGFVVIVLLFFLLFMAVVICASLILTLVAAMTGGASNLIVNVIIFFFVLTIAGIGICTQYQAFCDIFHQKTPDEDDDGTEIYTEI